MPTIANNAEGFTSSPTTPTTGNTGGGSGTACSTVTQGAASTIRATTGSALFGAYGYEFNLVANGSDGACRLMWAFAEAGRLVLSTYWEVDAAITATEDVMGVRHSSGNMGVLLVGSDGKLIMQHAGGSNIAASKATNALATGTRYRIEMSVAKGTTTSNGTLGFAYFLGDSATAEFSWESAAQNAGTANAATVWIGRSTGRTQAHVTKYDEMRAETLASGWLAPVAVPVTVAVPVINVTLALPAPGASSGVVVEVPGIGVTAALPAPSAYAEQVISGGGPIEVSVALPAPAVSAGVVVDVPPIAVTVAAHPPAVSVGAGVNVNVPAIEVAMAAAAPQVSAGVEVAVPAIGVSATAAAPTLLVGTAVAVPPITIAASLPAPVVAVGSAVVVAVPAIAATVAARAPVPAAGVEVQAPAIAVAVGVQPPALAIGVVVVIPAIGIAVALLPAIGRVETPTTPAYRIITAESGGRTITARRRA